jgi:molybdopterin molybdotransferase
MLRALVSEAGGAPQNWGTARDDVGPIRAALTRTLAACDLLLVCGGMSMGTRDHVPELIKELGVAIHIEKVRMKPGKPFIFGVREADGRRTYVAGLPGNPVSAYVTFQRFVRAAIARLGGSSDGGLHAVRCRAGRALEPNGDREFFQPCKVTGDDSGGLAAQPLTWKGSADLFTLAQADGLIVRPADAPAVAENEGVDVLMW